MTRRSSHAGRGRFRLVRFSGSGRAILEAGASRRPNPEALLTTPLPCRLAGTAAVLIALTFAGCGQSGDSGTKAAQPSTTAPRPAQTSQAAGADESAGGAEAKLAANRTQAGKVLDGDIEQTLAELKGVPVVVKQWASWCPQCHQEFPFFQELAKTYATKVAFVGLNARDDRGAAEAYSTDSDLKFPSIYDSDGAQSRAIGAGRSWPTTVFFNAEGRRVAVRPGAFASVGDLDDYIRRYALEG